MRGSRHWCKVRSRWRGVRNPLVRGSDVIFAKLAVWRSFMLNSWPPSPPTLAAYGCWEFWYFLYLESQSTKQCCGSGSESGSGRIRVFWVTRIRIRENTGSKSFNHKKTPGILIFSLHQIVLNIVALK